MNKIGRLIESRLEETRSYDELPDQLRSALSKLGVRSDWSVGDVEDAGNFVLIEIITMSVDTEDIKDAEKECNCDISINAVDGRCKVGFSHIPDELQEW